MKSGGFVDRMKTKNFYIVIAVVIVTSGTIWLMSYSPSTTFQNIVTKTHKGIKNLPSNIQIQSSHELTVNPLYLTRLGLDPKHPSLHGDPQNPPSNGEVEGRPVIASSLEGEGEKFEDALFFLESVSRYMDGYRVVMFDLTTSDTLHALLKKYCNSTWNCEVRLFDFDKYPSHVSDISLRSYRPICIQEILNKYGSVIWADSGQYFQASNVTEAVQQAREGGLAAWTVDDPTSAITHPKMLHFFKTRQELYYFHRAVQTSHIVLFSTPLVREKIMLPWVKCALLEDCINPTGAQHVGCNFMRRPLFKYSGCHYYDMSALNVILGPLYDYDERAYATKAAIFGSLVEDRLRAKNSSDPLHGSRVKLRAYLTGRGDDG